MSLMLKNMDELIVKLMIRSSLAIKHAAARCIACFALALRQDSHLVINGLNSELMFNLVRWTDKQIETKKWILHIFVYLIDPPSRKSKSSTSTSSKMTRPLSLNVEDEFHLPKQMSHLKTYAVPLLPTFFAQLQIFLDKMNNAILLTPICNVLRAVYLAFGTIEWMNWSDFVDLLIGWTIDPKIDSEQVKAVHSLLLDVGDFWRNNLDFAIQYDQQLSTDMIDLISQNNKNMNSDNILSQQESLAALIG